MVKLNKHVEIDGQFLAGGKASTLAGRPQSYREKSGRKPGVN